MSRNKSSNCFTGANATPLGPRNKAIGAKRSFGSTERESRASPPRQQPALSTNAALGLAAAQAAAAKLAKRVAAANVPEQPPLPPQPNIGMMAPPPPTAAPTPPSATGDSRGRPRKKRSRWGTPELKTDIPGIPTVLPANLTPIQQRAYILQLQIEDINRKLKSGTLGIPPKPEDRSPSPEPIYGSDGKRLNTREYRTRKRLEEDRHKYIMEMQDINPEFKPPVDYKPPMQRISERVMIPQDDNPLINFVGLLIGPRGNTLKRIEKETNCKIMIRGKGSVKEGKIGRKDGQPLPGEDEPLHALVSSGTLDCVQKAVKEIQKIIKEGIEQPEGQNDLRKLQLMELARLNGTLRDETMPREREWLRPENQNITNTTICQKCGGRGHLEQDCKAPRPSATLNPDEQATGGGVDRAKMDSEYMSLMAELGQGPAPGPPASGSTGNMGGPRPPSQGAQAPPWMSRGAGNGGSRFNSNNSGTNNGLYGNDETGGYNAGGGDNRRGGKWNQGNNNASGYGGGYGNQNYGSGQNNYGSGGQGNYGNTNNYGNSQGQGGNYGNNSYGNQNYGSGNSNYGSSGNVPWQQQQQQNSMGQPPMPFDSMAPPPPPPPNAPQPPPPSDDNPPGGKVPDGPPGMSGQSGGTGNNNWQGGNYGMWNQGGMNQPPMPSGPGPMPPPPPSGGSGSNSHGMGYGMMGMMGYGMQPAPPPPPPQN